MKRKELIQLLEREGCLLLRHGGAHDIYRNPANGRRAPVPRHSEIADTLAKLIFKQLGVESAN
ncbi:type II toxin-antitoxin system HicA family toxin [Desulfarculus baarsii]